MRLIGNYVLVFALERAMVSARKDSGVSTSYDYGRANRVRELLVDVQRRLPAGRPLLTEAFASDHRHPVQVKLGALTADTFYLFDENTAQAFSDAVIELAAQHGGGRVTVSYPASGEFRAQIHRLRHVAHKLDHIRVLAVERARQPGQTARGLEVHNVRGGPLAQYRVALCEGPRPLLFICRTTPQARSTENPRYLGLFSFAPDTVAEVADDVEQLLHGPGSQLAAFQRLELLHQTTQQVRCELESYSRRMDLAIRRARRRPDLLTPARFERIVSRAIAKMEELKEIPRRALRRIDKPAR